MSASRGYNQKTHPNDFIKLSRVYALGYSEGYENAVRNEARKKRRKT